MPDTESFKQLIQDARGGSRKAIEQLISSFSPYVLNAIRRRLHKKLRKKFDSTDFAQSVWKSFFVGGARENEFQSAEALIEFLMAMARNKTIDEVRRRLMTQRYNVNHEFAYSEVPHWALDDRVWPPEHPTPSQIVVGAETYENLKGMTTDKGAEAVEMRAIGVNFEEVATRLGIHEGSARRVLRRLRRKLQRQQNRHE
jgi:RNA polymerase sigma factor (sigma-70 family)